MKDHAATLSAAVALLLQCAAAKSQTMEVEKCYGVVKAGMNHCGANDHQCASKAKTDGDPREWVFLSRRCSILHGVVQMTCKIRGHFKYLTLPNFPVMGIVREWIFR
jgi:uncharacterized membrane protein